MAINTQVKRASVLGIVQPDGSVSKEDRRTVLGVYGGWFGIAVDVDPVTMTMGTIAPSVSTAPAGTGSSRWLLRLFKIMGSLRRRR